MSSAKIKRHLKLILKHPLQLSLIPIIVAAVTSTHILVLGIFILGFKSGVVILEKSFSNKPITVYPEYIPVRETSPVYNAEPINDEILKTDETDEQFEQEFDDLLMNLDSKTYALNKPEVDVLGVESSPNSAGVPVEKRMYNDNYKNQIQPDVNVITPANSLSLFSFKNIVLPVLALGFAVLGINYLDHHHTKRIKHTASHKKHK